MGPLQQAHHGVQRRRRRSDGDIKTGGGDPAELARQKIEDFRLGI
jgi:hypothetical protein